MFATAASVLGPVSAQAAPIDNKQAEAASLEQQITENGRRLDALNERINSAQIALDEANSTIAIAKVQVRAATTKTRELRSQLAKRAAVLYRRSGTTGGVANLDAKNANELTTRRKYTALAAQREKVLVTQLARAKEDLKVRKVQARAARADAAAQKQTIESTRAELVVGDSRYRQLLSQVKGEIAVLVRQEQEEREARERAEALARMPPTPVVTAEAAADATPSPTTTAAPTTTTSGSGSGSGSGTGSGSGSGSGSDSGSGSGSGTGTSAASGSAAPSPSGGASAAISYAYAQLGKPYCYAGVGPECFDCSGLTMMAWAQAGVSMPHGSTEQYNMFPHVPLSQAQPGDLIVWDGHVGLYIGGGQVIHAPRTGTVVQISSIWGSPWGAARPG